MTKISSEEWDTQIKKMIDLDIQRMREQLEKNFYDIIYKSAILKQGHELTPDYTNMTSCEIRRKLCSEIGTRVWIDEAKLFAAPILPDRFSISNSPKKTKLKSILDEIWWNNE